MAQKRFVAEILLPRGDMLVGVLAKDKNEARKKLKRQIQIARIVDYDPDMELDLDKTEW